MTKERADQIRNVSADMQEQAATICKIEEAMRSKVDEMIETYGDMPATQVVTSTQGEQVTKANPAMQEIRATFRDYCAIVKARQDILGSKSTPAEVTSINALRAKLKIAK